MCGNLLLKIESIHEQRFDFLEQNPAMQYVYEVLYDKQNIKDALEQAVALGQMATEDREYMRNLTRLKELLESRYDARSMDPTSALFDMV